MNELKIVTIGDGAVGKTSLIITYKTNIFPRDYIPYVLDPFTYDDTVNGSAVTLRVFDFGGAEDYDKLRPLHYPNTDAFVLCYSIETRLSFENIKSKWLPELKHHCPNVPIILVANKSDYRENEKISKICLKLENKRLVTESDGLELAKEIGAAKFIECSSLKQINVKEVFKEAAKNGLATNRRKIKQNCFSL